jgi:hypothetical protein
LDPRMPGHLYFDTSAFQTSHYGSEGTGRRRFFHGPGINNWNMAFHKDTPITERVNLQFRADFFNIFNHAQFATPLGLCSAPGGLPPGQEAVSCSSSLNTSGNFGVITRTSQLPRTAQLSLKLNF